MKMELMILAKSDKNSGYCVVGINKFGKFIRLVKNNKGHALNREQCKFNKMDLLTVNVVHAPLTHQKENYVLNDIISRTKTNIQTENLKKYVQNPEFIFSNVNPWLVEEEINNQSTSFLFVEISDLFIYENDEGKHKCDFTYNNNNYKGFSILGVRLPEIPYRKYGNDLYYKFVCAVYPLRDSVKSYYMDCYII